MIISISIMEGTCRLPQPLLRLEDYDVIAVLGVIAFFRRHIAPVKPLLSTHMFFNISSEEDIFY
jgi:hypothetical protein